MKTAVSIPDGLFRAAESLAKRMGLSRSELYQRALATYLKRDDDQLVTRALNEVYGSDAEASQLDPLLERLQLATLRSEEW
jgi:metal-responsive CopG/Arc/MetJ family transcriptional regulator